MIILIFVSLIVSIASFYALYYSVKRNFELIDLLEETNEQIDKAVEVMDFDESTVAYKLGERVSMAGLEKKDA